MGWKLEILRSQSLRPRSISFCPLNCELSEYSKVIKDDLLYLIYDLEVCDITYALAFVLVDAELESKARKKGFVVVIVPSSASHRTYLNFAEYDSAIDDDSKLWRLHNIIMPLISLSFFL